MYGEQKREYENLEEAAAWPPGGKAREGQTAQQTRATLLTSLPNYTHHPPGLQIQLPIHRTADWKRQN